MRHETHGLPSYIEGYILQVINGIPVWVSPSSAIVQVATYADLPLASDVPDQIYYVQTSTGVWLINRKSKGFWRSNGTTWEWAGEIIESFNTSNFHLYDNLDNTKQFQFTTSSIPTNTTVNYTIGQYDVDFNNALDGDYLQNLPCNSNVFIGAAVYWSGSQLELAIASSLTTSEVIGIVEAKPTATTARVRLSGRTTDVLTGLTLGATYWLSATDAGELVTSAPALSGSWVVAIGIAKTATKLLLNQHVLYQRAS